MKVMENKRKIKKVKKFSKKKKETDKHMELLENYRKKDKFIINKEVTKNND